MSVCRDVYVIGGVEVGQDVDKTTLCVLRDPFLCLRSPCPLIWSWAQVPSNVPMTTTDLTALVPEVSDPSDDLDHCSTSLVILNGLQNFF